jgi:hypothetical protein
VTGYRFRAGNAQEMADRMVQGVTAFADSETTANNCLKAIADFNPETSARQTLRGCKLLMSECA